jgi:hypothetical protein
MSLSLLFLWQLQSNKHSTPRTLPVLQSSSPSFENGLTKSPAGPAAAVLARHAGKVVPHGQLLKAVWGKQSQGQEHDVRIHIHKLR